MQTWTLNLPNLLGRQYDDSYEILLLLPDQQCSGHLCANLLLSLAEVKALHSALGLYLDKYE
jgi:hypothetical protein